MKKQCDTLLKFTARLWNTESLIWSLNVVALAGTGDRNLSLLVSQARERERRKVA